VSVFIVFWWHLEIFQIKRTLKDTSKLLLTTKCLWTDTWIDEKAKETFYCTILFSSLYVSESSDILFIFVCFFTSTTSDSFQTFPCRHKEIDISYITMRGSSSIWKLEYNSSFNKIWIDLGRKVFPWSSSSVCVCCNSFECWIHSWYF